MGLFGKKKEKTENINMDPPIPQTLSDIKNDVIPQPQANSPENQKLNDNNNNKQNEMPVVENNNMNNLMNENEQIPQSLSQISKLNTPPIPGENNFNNNDNSNNEIPMPPKVEMENQKPSESKISNNNQDNDDLFKMFGFDNNELNLSPENEIQQESQEYEKHSYQNEIPNNYDEQMPKFLTTNQFKSMLETIEEVKNKIKESNESHMSLLDMKAEEDIEYENLRKNFQFLEEKLYDLDKIIFEK